MITKFGLKIGFTFWIIVGIFLAVFGSGESYDPHAINPWEIAQKAFNIILLLDIIFFFTGKTFAEFFTGRKDTIKTELAEAGKNKSSFEKELASVVLKMKTLDREIEEILTKAREDARQEKEEIIRKAHAEAEKLVEMTKNEIESEYAQAQKKLKSRIAELALVKSEEIVKKEIKPADHKKLVKEYISFLEGIE